jgi:hypothetical protein
MVQCWLQIHAMNVMCMCAWEIMTWDACMTWHVIFDDDMLYDMACQAMTKANVECQLTCKKLSFLSQDFSKRICITSWHVCTFLVWIFLHVKWLGSTCPSPNTGVSYLGTWHLLASICYAQSMEKHMIRTKEQLAHRGPEWTSTDTLQIQRV